ncbi:putative ubiquitin carboxyl-terminal hydrolase 50 [Triplophysa tibetana]|uniref:ubiquitinyl hydrolase 1 n=1 Tax=Triplophysa tibetana TaxID=1572043 RepID=A0A5A9NXV6_9TELE|nr:putative ubiquitin carboxyl-terminal hydrolase 50 [Triplophysa tibetana]
MCGEDQQIFCNDCQLFMDTEMSSSLQKVPFVLVLHLERFELDYDTMCCVKNDSLVQIPARLSVEEKADKTNKYSYDLYAMANHVGSLNGGHYYAVIKSFEDKQWYRFDDHFVEEIKKRSMHNFVPKITNSESTNREKEVSNTEIIKENYENPEKNLKNTYSIKEECEDPEKDEMNNYIIEECKASEKYEMSTDSNKETCKNPEKDGINSDRIKDECENHEKDEMKTAIRVDCEDSEKNELITFNPDSIKVECEYPEKNKMNTNSIKGQCEYPEKDDMYIDSIKDESDDAEEVEMNTDIRHEFKNPEKVDMNADIRDECKGHDKKEMNTHNITDECKDHEIDETNSKIIIYCVESQHSFDLEEKKVNSTDNFAVDECPQRTIEDLLRAVTKAVDRLKLDWPQEQEPPEGFKATRQLCSTLGFADPDPSGPILHKLSACVIRRCEVRRYAFGISPAQTSEWRKTICPVTSCTC